MITEQIAEFLPPKAWLDNTTGKVHHEPDFELAEHIEALCREAFEPKWNELYKSVNELMAVIGAEGEIDSDHPSTERVMNALYDIDGGSPPKEQE